MAMINSLDYGDGAHTFTLPYGVCSTAAATAAKTVTVDNFSLEAGAVVIVKFTNANSVASPTLNVNDTGAKPIMRYGTTAASTGTTTSGWIAGAVQLFVYDGTNWIREYWNNTTYSNVALGQGYATCTTAEATTAKVGTLSSYALTTGGIVSVKFTYAVPASSTLNINSKGAKAIYHKGAAIKAGVIKAGDIATFIYNGTYYHLISVDRMAEEDCLSLGGGEITGNLEMTKETPTIWLNNTTKNNQGCIQMYGDSLSLYSREVAGSGDNQRAIIIANATGQTDKADAIRLMDKVDGTTTYYDIFGSHNMTNALKKMFPSTATATYIPVFGSGWESRGYTTPASLLSAMGANGVELFSYAGTGVGGSSSNAISYTFKNVPKLMFWLGCINTSTGEGDTMFASYNVVPLMVTSVLSTSYKNTGATFNWNYGECYAKKSSNGKTITWYSDPTGTGTSNANKAKAQFNTSGKTFYGIAIY